MRRRSVQVSIAGGGLSVLAAGALSAALLAAPPPLVSAWRSAAIAIDGAVDEWPALETLENKVSAAAANDSEFLYLAVSGGTTVTRALLATGLIVWLDPSGGKGQNFGIWMQGLEPPALPGATPDAPRQPAAGWSGHTLTQFDLLGPNKNQRRLIDSEATLGIELATGTDQSALVYELKVPLQGSAQHKYAVNAKSGATIGIGLATPQSPRERSSRPTMVGSGGMIGGNPYLGGANGGGFADFGEPDERMKPLQIWTTIKLAGKP
jgi:hypothetical protein